MLNIGLTAECSVIVDNNNTGATVGSGSLPVFATPSLAALVEKTACVCLEGKLDDGCTTVGTVLQLKHLAPTPVGMTVSCRCTLEEIDGRRLAFKAVVSDGAGVVGEVYHERFVIKAEPFMAKAQSRSENRG